MGKGAVVDVNIDRIYASLYVVRFCDRPAAMTVSTTSEAQLDKQTCRGVAAAKTGLVVDRGQGRIFLT